MEVAVAEARKAGKEVVREGHSITLRKEELPWFEQNAVRVELVTFQYGGAEFLFGSAIKSNKDLKAAAEQLDKHRSEICNQLLYSQLPPFSEGFNPRVTVVENPRTRQPIFELGNKGGQRVFFMRFGKIDGKPVIVKVAVCDKAREQKVLSTITTSSKKYIKRAGGL